MFSTTAVSRSLALALCALSGAAVFGQSVTERSLPAGVPSVIEGPSFAAPGALAVAGEGRILVLGTSSGITSRVLTAPSLALTMGRPWSALSATRAVYASLGADGVARTTDDELVIVDGLPGQPVLSPTGVFTAEDFDWLPLSEGLAVHQGRFGSSLQRLRHTASQAWIETVPLGIDLGNIDARFEWVRVGPTSIATLTPGIDGQWTTGDERLLLVRGLGEIQPTNVVAQVFLLPTSFPVSGCTALPNGALLLYGNPLPYEPERIRYRVISFDSGQPDPGPEVDHVFTAVLPPLAFGQAPSMGAAPGRGGSFLAWIEDEFQDREFALFTGVADGHPVLRGTWSEDFSSGRSIQQIAERLALETSAISASGFFVRDYARANAPVIHADQRPIAKGLIANAPIDGALCVARGTPGGASGQPIAAMTLLANLDRLPVIEAHFERIGVWTSGGISPMTGEIISTRLFSVGAAQVVGFVSTDADPEPEIARIASLPSLAVVGKGLVDEDEAPIQIEPLGLLPGEPSSLGSGIAIEVDPSMEDVVLLVLSSTLLPGGVQGAPLAPGAVLHVGLDPASAFALPVNVTGAVVDLPFAVSSAARAVLTGVPLRLQAFGLERGTGAIYASDCWQIVLR